MRKILQLLLFLFLFTSVTCNNTGNTNSGKATQNPTVQSGTEKNVNGDNATQLAGNKCKTLFVIAEDRSGSTGDHRKLSKNDYKLLINAFRKYNSGQIAVRIIGNPEPSEREFFLLKVNPFKPYLKMTIDDPMLSEKTLLRNKNMAIEKENKKIDSLNKRTAQRFIDDKVQKHIIGYKPYKGKDLTNISDVLAHIEIKVNEPTFKSYDNIQVLIVSDGKHDANRLKEKLHFQGNDLMHLFLIGWKDKAVFADVKNQSYFDSVDGFIAYYQDLKCNKL